MGWYQLYRHEGFGRFDAALNAIPYGFEQGYTAARKAGYGVVQSFVGAMATFPHYAFVPTADAHALLHTAFVGRKSEPQTLEERAA